MSTTTPSRLLRGVDVPGIDTRAPQEKYASALSYAGCPTPPQSAHDSRRGSLAYCTLPDAGYASVYSAHSLSQPVTPVQNNSPIGHAFSHQWQQLSGAHTMNADGPSTSFLQNHLDAHLQAALSQAPGSGTVPGGFVDPYEGPADLQMDAMWHDVQREGWNEHGPSDQTQPFGLSSTLFQSHPSLGQGSHIGGSSHSDLSNPTSGLRIDTTQASSFTSVVSHGYSQSQITVVPSQLSPDDYILQPYSAYSSPNGGHESLTTSFASTNASFASFEYTTPPTSDDAYGYAGDEDWVHEKGENPSPTPGMMVRGHRSATTQSLPCRSRRRNAKRSKARQPRERWTTGAEDNIIYEVEGNACGVGYDFVKGEMVLPENIQLQLKPHICGMLDEKTGKPCTSRFDRSEHLKRHQAKHSNARPYMCPLPNCKHTKGIGRGDNAKDHFKTHLKGTKKGRRNAQYLWPEVKRALLCEFQDEKVSTNLITNIERWIRTNKEGERQRNRYGEPLTESDLDDV